MKKGCRGRIVRDSSMIYNRRRFDRSGARFTPRNPHDLSAGARREGGRTSSGRSSGKIYEFSAGRCDARHDDSSRVARLPSSLALFLLTLLGKRSMVNSPRRNGSRRGVKSTCTDSLPRYLRDSIALRIPVQTGQTVSWPVIVARPAEKRGPPLQLASFP